MTGASGPRTVLYIVQAAFFAGAERALLLLIGALDRARYRPHVIVGTDGEMRAQLDALRVPQTYVDLVYTNWRQPGPWLRSVGRIARVARSVGASLVHGNGVPGFQPAGYAARLLRIPAVVHVRGRLPSYAWFLRPGFRRALFVSRDVMTYALERDSPAFSPGGEVVYDGVAMPVLPAENERRARLAELGIPADVPSVVLSGQVVEIKGIWEYIEAARMLTEAGVRATYVVLGEDLRGEGATRRKAEARVAELGLASHFRFLGFRADAPSLIPLFDIASVPSHQEPLGNATLEAMAAARPVVGSRVGGIPEMIVHGETGLLIEPRSAEALAAALRRLIEDPSVVRRFGQAGRERATLAFSLPAHAAHVQRIYDEVLAAAAPRGKGH